MKINLNIAKNISLLTFSSLLNKLLTLFFIIIAAKKLNIEQMGQYNLVWTFIGIFALISDFGMTNVIIKEIAQKNNKEKYFGTSILLKIILSFLSYILIFPIINIINYSTFIKNLIIIMGIILFSNNVNNLLQIAGSIKQNFKYFIIVNTFLTIFIFISNLLILHSTINIKLIFINTLLWNILFSIISLILINKYLIKIKINIDLSEWKRIIVNSISYSALTLIGLIYFKVDVILLSKLKSVIEVGYYSAIYKFFEAWLLIPGAFTIVMLPIFSKLSVSSILNFKKSIQQWLIIMGLLGISISIMTYIISYYVIILILGYKYLPALPALKIIVWGIPLTFVNIVLYNAFYAIGKQKTVTLIFFLSTIFNIVFNLIFIPKYSFIGSSWATIISEVINLFLAFIFLKIYFNKMRSKYVS